MPLQHLTLFCGKAGSWHRVLCVTQAEGQSALGVMTMRHFCECSEVSIEMNVRLQGGEGNWDVILLSFRSCTTGRLFHFVSVFIVK